MRARFILLFSADELKEKKKNWVKNWEDLLLTEEENEEDRRLKNDERWGTDFSLSRGYDFEIWNDVSDTKTEKDS